MDNSYSNNSIMPEILASVISVVAGLMTYISRLGFDNDFILIMKSVLLSFFLIFTPNQVMKWRKVKNGSYKLLSKPLIFLLLFMIIIIVSYIESYININLLNYFCLIGIIATIKTIIGIKRIFYFRSDFLLLCIFIVFGMWATSIYCNDNYIHPLMKEKIITGAWAHRDYMYFSSISGMFKTYGISGTGLDGLLPHSYHVLSYNLYGILSRLMNVSTMTFYSRIVPVLITPIFFLLFIWCVFEFKKYYYRLYNYSEVKIYRINFYLLLLCIFSFPLSRLFLLPIPFYSMLETYQYIISPSYFIALLISFIFISIIISILNNYRYNIKINPKINRVAIFSIPIFFYVISYTKLSFLYIFGMCFLYILLRLKLLKISEYRYSAFLSLVVFIIISTKLIFNFDGGMHGAFNASGGPQIFNNYIFNYYISELFHYPFYIYPSLIFIVIKFYCFSVNSFNKLIDNVKSYYFLDVELLLFLMIISFIPPYGYFKGIQIYLSYFLILSHFNLFLDRLFNSNNIILSIPYSEHN